MPLILLLHLILDASVSIIRAYNELLRGHPCLIDLVIDIFNNYLRLRSTTTPTGKLHGAISKCIYNMIFKSPFNYCYIAI
jgi:hypothetical protein